MAEISNDKLDQMLEEVATFQIDLVEDPTLPQYGSKYLHEQLSKCRAFLNRVQHYLQVCKLEEKKMRRTIAIIEADIDLKMKTLLAEDMIVRKQPSIEDRKAMASSMLKEEHGSLSEAQIKMSDLDDTIKLLKMKYGDLRSSNSDIRLQRQITRDNIVDFPDGEAGGNSRSGRIVGNGLAPSVVRDIIDPKDLFDDEKRPEDVPVPKDMAHAKQIADFYNSMGPGKKETKASNEESKLGGVSFESLLD